MASDFTRTTRVPLPRIGEAGNPEDAVGQEPVLAALLGRDRFAHRVVNLFLRLQKNVEATKTAELTGEDRQHARWHIHL